MEVPNNNSTSGAAHYLVFYPGLGYIIFSPLWNGRERCVRPAFCFCIKFKRLNFIA